jgi:hypothetical protein
MAQMSADKKEGRRGGGGVSHRGTEPQRSTEEKENLKI